MKRMGFMAVIVIAAVSGACNREARNEPVASERTIGTAGDADRNMPSDSDREFIDDLVIANMAEVRLGTLATQKSANAEVKKFAEMMVADHTKAGDALKAVASSHHAQVPLEVDSKHRDLYDKLAKLQGAEFDREYAAAMVDGHQDVADTLESRIDRERLQTWKTEMADWLSGKKVDHSNVGTVTPEHSDNAATMAVNQWAADSYPVVQGHLVSAKAMKSGVDKRR